MSSFTARRVLSALILVVVALGGMSSYLAFCRQPVSFGILSSQVVVNDLIVLGEVKPIDFYLSQLESSGAAPYVQLAVELRKLPDLTNATAVAKITWLALNATNPEVKEAFDLMVKGGTPDRNDFRFYDVSSWNAELQVLYWLACQNEFKKEDTLALAIAMVNGLWVTMGDEQVTEAVRRDTSSMFRLGRETSEWQKAMGLSYNLEGYPLEAKICWAWTGSDPGRGGHYIIDYMYSGKRVNNPSGKSLNLHPLTEYQQQRLDLKGYVWNTVDPANLPRMRKFILERNWFYRNAAQAVVNTDRRLRETQNYTSPNDDFIVVDRETTVNHNMNNADFEFECLLSVGKTVGVCDDQATIVDAFLKSVGISSDLMVRTWIGGAGASHTHVFYYDPGLRTWSAWSQQLQAGSESLMWNVNLVRPPVNLGGFLSTHTDTVNSYFSKMLNSYSLIEKTSPSYVQNLFSKGVDNLQMTRWLLYGEKPTITAPTYAKWVEPEWTTQSDGSLDLLDQKGSKVGDLGQPYVDLGSVSYSHLNGTLFFRFSLNGRIPDKAFDSHVTGFWYQVLIDVDSDSGTGYYWSSNFSPDYMLQLDVRLDSSKRVSVQSSLLMYSGSGNDWSWMGTEFTQRFGPQPIIVGGAGQDFFVLSCDYQDVFVSQGTMIKFLPRSGIRYDNNVYNDYAPDAGTLAMNL